MMPGIPVADLFIDSSLHCRKPFILDFIEYKAKLVILLLNILKRQWSWRIK